jgi:hypothetical protein
MTTQHPASHVVTTVCACWLLNRFCWVVLCADRCATTSYLPTGDLHARCPKACPPPTTGTAGRQLHSNYMLYHAMLSMPPYAMPCVCYAMLCYAMLCYAMLTRAAGSTPPKRTVPEGMRDPAHQPVKQAAAQQQHDGVRQSRSHQALR